MKSHDLLSKRSALSDEGIADMKQRIAAGALVIRDNKMLLVNHRKEGAYDFWVAPGGGVIGTETLEEAATREVKEEAGLIVEVDRLLYIEEFWQPEQREIKLWYLCTYLAGDIDVSAEEAAREYIVDAKFMSKEEMQGLIVFPEVVPGRIWDDLSNKAFSPAHLGLTEMRFC